MPVNPGTDVRVGSTVTILPEGRSLPVENVSLEGCRYDFDAAQFLAPSTLIRAAAGGRLLVGEVVACSLQAGSYHIAARIEHTLDPNALDWRHPRTPDYPCRST
jgi:hypothetical protein